MSTQHWKPNGGSARLHRDYFGAEDKSLFWEAAEVLTLHKTLGETKGDLTCTPHGGQRHERLTSQHLEMLLRRAHHSPYSLPMHHPLLSSVDMASRHSSDKETTQVRDKSPKIVYCLLTVWPWMNSFIFMSLWALIGTSVVIHITSTRQHPAKADALQQSTPCKI